MTLAGEKKYHIMDYDDFSRQRSPWEWMMNEETFRESHSPCFGLWWLYRVWILWGPCWRKRNISPLFVQCRNGLGWFFKSESKWDFLPSNKPLGINGAYREISILVFSMSLGMGIWWLPGCFVPLSFLAGQFWSFLFLPLDALTSIEFSPLHSNMELFNAAFWCFSKGVVFEDHSIMDYGSLSSTFSTIFLEFDWSLGTFWWLDCCTLICS